MRLPERSTSFMVLIFFIAIEKVFMHTNTYYNCAPEMLTYPRCSVYKIIRTFFSKAMIFTKVGKGLMT